jgi:hypothetical protein
MDTTTRLSSLTASQLTQARAADYVRCLSVQHEGTTDLAGRFTERFPHSLSRSLFTKAAIAAGTPSDATWGGPLAVAKPLRTDFVALVRAAALIGKIAGLRRVPFNVKVTATTTGGTYGWVGPGKPKPVGALALATVQLEFAKACGILIVTEELLSLGAPGSEALLRDELVRGTAGFLDAQFFTPTVAAVANVNPASVTNTAVPIVSSGTSAANAHTDINALVRAFVTANPDVSTAVMVLSPANAMALAATGDYKDLTMHGGFIAGVPAVTTAAAGTTIAMLDPSGILAALDDIEIDVSKNTSVEMEVPVTDPSTAATVMRSLWQLNLCALKVTAYANWKLARASAVQIVTGAAYV